MKINTEKLQNLWNSDEIRVLVLGSLTIQIALIFLAPLRKRISNIMLTLTLWLLYLTADNVATLGLGNISHQTPPGIGVSSELTVLWAPFLLVHLGGPDTITSYSIEDNELWWRHLLGLLFQVIITVYIFIQSPPTGWMWIPTIFVFIPGLIKFAERTHALRVASKDNIKDKIISELRLGIRSTEGYKNPVPANETTKGFWGLMGSIQSVLFPQEDSIDILVSTLTDISKVKGVVISNEGAVISNEGVAILEGFCWFNIFKRLLVDVTFPADLLMKSQDRFSDLSPKDALKLVTIELSFLYDYLHTKAVHMHSIVGRALRYFSLVSIIAAFVVFHHLDMKKYVFGDIIITYILFCVGLSLEVIATIFLVFSDWTVVALEKTKHSKCVVRCITQLVKAILKKRSPRWANKIGQFNLVDVCLRDKNTILAKIMRILKIKNKWDNMRESKLIPLLPGGDLEKIMVTEAKRRAQNVHIYKVLVEARAYRGNKTLERHNQLEKLEWSMKREFDESIILWHLATDICYYQDQTSNKSNGEKRKPSHKPCCLKSCLSSKQSKENQEPSHQPDGENQQPSNQPNGENQEHSNQPDGENQQPSNQSNGENQKPSSQPNRENQEHSNQPDGENQQPSNQPNGENQKPSSQPNRENQEHSNQPDGENQQSSNQPDGENQEHSNQPDGENQQPSNQPNGENQKPSSQPNRENQEHSNQPDGENQQSSNQPDGENQEHSNQPDGENQQPSNQPNGENQEHSNQPDGENQQPSNQPNGENQKPSSQHNRENQEHSDQHDGENQQPSNQPNGENQQASDQPNGENQEHSDQPNERNEELSNQPNGRKKILINRLKSCCYSKPNGENQQPSNKPCLSCLCSKQPNGENQQPSHQPSCLKSCLSSKQSNEKEDTERDVSWKTSNYMIYLLTQQQSMMQLGYGKTRFEATCAVVKKKLKGEEKLDPKKARDGLMKQAENKGAPPDLGQNNASVPANSSQPTNKMGTSVLKKIWAYLRCWGKRKRKDDEAAQVSEENNASVTADASQPTNKMGTSVLKKIWAYLRCWGKRKRKDDEAAQVSEENNASVTADASQPTNKMGTSVLKKIWAYLRCWGKRKRKDDEAAQVSEENNAPVSTDSSQTTNKMGTSVLKKIWECLRCWGRRKREEEKRKRQDENEMGEKVLKDGLKLAKELQALGSEIKWKLISETWMEMLGYAAIHCDSYQHAKSLSRGGELLTHLWLLMSQLGVVEEHKMQQYQSGTV